MNIQYSDKSQIILLNDLNGLRRRRRRWLQ